MTCVVDSKGQGDHCVTIYKDWIYDGNFSHALPLQKKSLDLCCSSDDLQLLFTQTKNCYRFPLFDMYLKTRQNKDTKMHENQKRNKKNKRKQKLKQQQRKKQRLE